MARVTMKEVKALLYKPKSLDDIFIERYNEGVMITLKRSRAFGCFSEKLFHNYQVTQVENNSFGEARYFVEKKK